MSVGCLAGDQPGFSVLFRILIPITRSRRLPSSYGTIDYRWGFFLYIPYYISKIQYITKTRTYGEKKSYDLIPIQKKSSQSSQRGIVEKKKG